MKRNPRKLKWTKAFRKRAGKEMVVDSSLKFAARRNIPVRYNRHLMLKTVQAMKRISEIRQRRERVFYKTRMAGNSEREKELNRKLVASHSHLLPRMRGSQKKALELQEANAADCMEDDSVQVKKEASKVFGGEKIRSRKGILRMTEKIDDEMNID